MFYSTPYAVYIGSNPQFKKGKTYHLMLYTGLKFKLRYCDTVIEYENQKEFEKEWEILE